MPGVTVGTGGRLPREAVPSSCPPGFSHDYLADSRQYVQEGNQLAVTFGFALIIIFLVLAAQFESLRDPLVIMISVPMAIVGALLPLFFGVGDHEHLHPGRAVDAGRADQQARHPDGRVRQRAAAQRRSRPPLGDRDGRAGPAASDPDDDRGDGHGPHSAAASPPAPARRAGSRSASSSSSGMSIGTLFTLFVLPAVYVAIATDHRAGAESERAQGDRRVRSRPETAQADVAAERARK